MASTCAVATITAATAVTQPRQRISASLRRNHGVLDTQQASFSTNKYKMVSVATTAAAAMAVTLLAVPDVANAAGPAGLSPSLKNFLLSIGAGGLVLTVIIGVVVGVSNFDPVRRD